MAIIVVLVVGAGVGYLAGSSGKSSGTVSTSTTGLSGTITLGALIPQTGAIPTGTSVSTALNMAITQLNANLQAAGLTNLQFAIKIEDTQTNPSVALTEMQTLASQGVKVFLGPMDSAETSNLLSYADSNHLVLLETGTAATIANLNNSYRFIIVPNDDTETVALASIVYSKGFTCAVTLWRDDSWGVPFSQAFDQQYAALGGKVLDNLTYSPSTTGSVDFTSQLTQMQTDYNNGQTSCGSGKVAVVAMQFSELAGALSQAQSYPSLKNAQWFTDDTEVNDASFAPAVGSLASGVKLEGTTWTTTASQATLAFDQAYNKTLGHEPSSYELAMYDGVFLAAQAIMIAGKYDGQAVQQVMASVSQTFFGISGYMGMNSQGDRGPTDYNVYEMNPTNSSAAAWQDVGTWSFASHQVTYNSFYRQ
ncbi:MAG: hypothetical protein OK454_00945 [Thaumarchaeota archaeon]|nr:hypothetical protein [Nitrososphaerota archaeon]